MHVLTVGIPGEVIAAIKGALKGVAASKGETCEVVQVEDEKQALQEILKNGYSFVFTTASKETLLKFIPIEKRRQMVCVVLDIEARSLDPFAAFLKNADGVINPKDLNNFQKYLSHIFKRHEELYRGFLKVKVDLELY